MIGVCSSSFLVWSGCLCEFIIGSIGSGSSVVVTLSIWCAQKD